MCIRDRTKTRTKRNENKIKTKRNETDLRENTKQHALLTVEVRKGLPWQAKNKQNTSAASRSREFCNMGRYPSLAICAMHRSGSRLLEVSHLQPQISKHLEDCNISHSTITSFGFLSCDLPCCVSFRFVFFETTALNCKHDSHQTALRCEAWSTLVKA